MHDPSTVVHLDGRFYSYGTGNGLPVSVSDDGWTWRRAGRLMQALPGGRPGPEVVSRGGNNTWAPDVIRPATSISCTKDIVVTLADR